MSTRCYDTDLNDAAWAWVAPYLPPARSGGRPRTTDLRAVLNAIFYLLRTGCQWRLLPREFPRPGTVYHYFRLCCNFWNGAIGVCDRGMNQPSNPNIDTTKLYSGAMPPSGQHPKAW